LFLNEDVCLAGEGLVRLGTFLLGWREKLPVDDGNGRAGRSGDKFIVGYM
jgi:hypothetical protein